VLDYSIAINQLDEKDKTSMVLTGSSRDGIFLFKCFYFILHEKHILIARAQARSPLQGPAENQTQYRPYARIKKKTKFSSYIRKFWWDRLQRKVKNKERLPNI
jgi:hypothetical protein